MAARGNGDSRVERVIKRVRKKSEAKNSTPLAAEEPSQEEAVALVKDETVAGNLIDSKHSELTLSERCSNFCA